MAVENSSDKTSTNEYVPSDWDYLFLVTNDSIEDVFNNYTVKELIELRMKLDFFNNELPEA